MTDYFESDFRRGMQLMSRCMEMDINAIQIGFRPSEPPIQKLILFREPGLLVGPDSHKRQAQDFNLA